MFLELPYFTKELNEISTPMDWWMYVLKNLAKLDHLPDTLRNNIFESLFSIAEIAKLSKKDRKEYDRSLKKLFDMNTIIVDRDRKIAALTKDNAVLSKDIKVLSKELAVKEKRIAELERRYGLDSKQKSNYN
jgi:hypothetical protein